MTITSNYNESDVLKRVTVDNKSLADYTERELDNIRRRVANLLRTKPVPADQLSYILSVIAGAYGEYTDAYTVKQLTL